MKRKKPFNKTTLSYVFWLVLFGILIAEPSYADLASSLQKLKLQLTGILLPILAVMGVALSALSFFTGNPQAKQHIFYAILGCIFGFGAQAIVDFISTTIK